jgi:hypothetical protein
MKRAAVKARLLTAVPSLDSRDKCLARTDAPCLRFTAQRNELLCRVLCHNLCVLVTSMYELGIAAELGGKKDGGGHVH